MQRNRLRQWPGIALAATSFLVSWGCSAANDDPVGTTLADGPSNTSGTADGAGGGGATTDGATDGSGTTPATSNDGTGSDSASEGTAPPNEVPPEVAEMLDPNVDWEALTLVYDTMYSAFDGVHTFQVPVYVDGVTIELSDWSAIPASAVIFDPDPDNEGVLVTIVEDVPEITIAARSGDIGGTAPLFVTSATPEQWAAGEARYANGIELDLGTVDLEAFAMALLDPTWMPPPPDEGLACNNCHTSGAKYFEIQHTPTQAARFSDEELRAIMTTGSKPEGVGFRILPEMFGAMTDQETYEYFHKWDATEEEITGLIIYMRSLTPTGQGDILLPDGTYVAPGGADGAVPAP